MSASRTCQTREPSKLSAGREIFSLETRAVDGLIWARAIETVLPKASEVVPCLRDSDPLLADLESLTRRLPKSGVRLAIRSHGLALTHARYQKLRSSLGAIEVYLDHPKRSTWGMMGKADYYDRVLDNLREIAPFARRDGVRIGFDSTGSLEDLLHVLRLASWLKLHSVRAIPRNPSRGCWDRLAEEADSLGLILLNSDGVPVNEQARFGELLDAIPADGFLGEWVRRTRGRIMAHREAKSHETGTLELSELGHLTRSGTSLGNIAVVPSKEESPTSSKSPSKRSSSNG